MSESKVFALKPVKYGPIPEVISQIEELLDDAKRGDVVEIVAVSRRSDLSVFYIDVGKANSRFEMLGAINYAAEEYKKVHFDADD